MTYQKAQRLHQLRCGEDQVLVDVALFFDWDEFARSNGSERTWYAFQATLRQSGFKLKDQRHELL
jgi:hypothetical protein